MLCFHEPQNCVVMAMTTKLLILNTLPMGSIERIAVNIFMAKEKCTESCYL